MIAVVASARVVHSWDLQHSDAFHACQSKAPIGAPICSL